MRFEKAFIPYGGYWSTPFCRWQGSFAHLHSLRFAAEVARRALEERGIEPARLLDGLFLGMTVPQRSSFYGAPWAAGLLGAPAITGPTVSQACATSARVIASAALEIEAGAHEAILGLLCDRTSNSPHVYYPNPLKAGGIGQSEDWVWENFSRDPFARVSMLETAENVAREAGIDRRAQDEVALLRARQYEDALRDDAAFLRRFLVAPIEVRDPSGRKVIHTVTGDEGVHPTTAEGLARLEPLLKGGGGTVTFGTQTHPADGSAGILVATRERAAALARDRAVEVRLLSYGEGRVEPGRMGMANVPAARRALAGAGLEIGELKAIKTHNPFAVNDVYFAREMGIEDDAMNRYGSSLVWGHPQAPTGARLVIELIEELAIAGGGRGLFTGCAAGDTAFALVLEVG